MSNDVVEPGWKRIIVSGSYSCDHVDVCHNLASYEEADGARLCTRCHLERLPEQSITLSREEAQLVRYVLHRASKSKMRDAAIKSLEEKLG